MVTHNPNLQSQTKILGHKANCPLVPIYNVENQVLFSLEKRDILQHWIGGEMGGGGTSSGLRLKKVSGTFQALDLDEPVWKLFISWNSREEHK